MNSDDGEGSTIEALTPASETTGYVPRLRRPHSLISRTSCKSHGCSGAGHPMHNDPDGVDVRVSKQMFKTALSILDQLFKEVEKREIKVVCEPGYSGGTYAVRGRERVAIALSERFRRLEHVPTPKEQAQMKEHAWDRPPKWDFFPSGELNLTPGGTLDLSSEESVAAMVLDSAHQIDRELNELKERREASELAQRKEWERRERVAHEQKKTDSLLKSAKELRQYHLLLDYIEEVRRLGRIPAEQHEPGQSLDDWLVWAQAKALSMHPLR